MTVHTCHQLANSSARRCRPVPRFSGWGAVPGPAVSTSPGNPGPDVLGESLGAKRPPMRSHKLSAGFGCSSRVRASVWHRDQGAGAAAAIPCEGTRFQGGPLLDIVFMISRVLRSERIRQGEAPPR